jgi:hypothetical protein
MNEELKVIGSYIRAVFREWWVILIEVLLVMTDAVERVVGTWLLPSSRTKVVLGLAVLVIAQYRAYRKVLLQAQVSARIAEAALRDKNDGVQVRVRLAALLQKGQKLEENLRTCVEPAHFSAWDGEENTWVDSVTQTLTAIGFPNYAAEFTRAGTEAAFVPGPVNIGHKQEKRLRRLRLRQKALENMAREIKL